jgi:hypothetical protein
MKSSNKINLNINSDDENLNDFLYSWSEFGVRPSKISLHGIFDSGKFLNYLETLTFTQITNSTDFVTTDDVPIINQKVLINLNVNGFTDTFLTYTHLDKIHEKSLISDVSIFYTGSSKEKVEKIVEDISELSIQSDEPTELVDTKVNLLSLGQNGFELEKHFISKDFEDIEYYYEDTVIKKVKKILKSINKDKTGLTIFCGERGCGKTTLLSYISSKLDKNVIFIPCNLIETSINNFEFRIFLKQNPNSVIILDDVELYFSQLYAKSTFFTNNLLQLIDGFYSSELNLNIILSLNCDSSDIDKNLFESNCLIDLVEVGKLSLKKVNELCDYLDKKNKFDVDTKLIDIIRKPIVKSTDVELGFK